MSGDEARMIGFVPSSDLDRAIPFYRDALGLELVEWNDFALVFRSGEQMVRVALVGVFTPQPFTILGWETADIRAVAQRLADSGVELIRYPEMEQDDLGVWTAPDGAKVVWLNDPDGNVLSFTEF